MTNIDNIISQLRSKKATSSITQTNTQGNIASLQDTAKKYKTEDENTKENDDAQNSTKAPHSALYSSSQPDRIVHTQDVRVKTDYNKLQEVKDNKNSIRKIHETQELLLNDKLYVMLFHVHVNEFFMVKLEFSDETGTVSGTMQYDLYKAKKYKVGDVFEIQNCAVWRSNGTYLVLHEDAIVNVH